ncbi:MAG: TIGR03643 family protein [Verrucomicrobiota bacterium]
MELERVDEVIRLAWADRVSFEEIEKRTGITEAEVIKVMRAHLKPSSFRLWRARVSGRGTKHRKRFKEAQREPRNWREEALEFFDPNIARPSQKD